MKSIVVEGKTDYYVLKILFPHLNDRNVEVRVAQGFSNVFAVSKSLVDYGYEVLAVLDTDSNIHGDDNRKIMSRLLSPSMTGRKIDVVWMNSCLEDVLKKASPNIHLNHGNGIILQQSIRKNKASILRLDEFQQIQSFIDRV